MATLHLVVFTLLLCSCCSARHLKNSANSQDDDFLAILNDREISEKQDSSSAPVKFVPNEKNIPKVGELFEGDMVMSARLRDAVLGTDKRSALQNRETRWPNGVVPYTFSKDIHPYMKHLIMTAIRMYKKFTCILLKWRTTETNYVEFTSKPNTCSSSVGMVGGKQVIKLGIGCRVLGTPLHEIMHALGFIHEQSRPDRDKHVKVVYDNINQKLIHNFQKYTYQDVTNLDTPYNFNSVMHYRNNAFTINGEDTLVALKDPDLRFGQRIMFSSSDVGMINRLYNCHKHVYRSKVRNDYLVPDMTETKIARKRSQTIFGDDDDDADDDY